MKQACKNCGAQDGFNFNVSNTVWQKVLPKRLWNRVVCLACFDSFAARRKVDYRRSLRVVYFAGQRMSFKFRVVWSACSREP